MIIPAEIRRESRSVKNRVASILSDSEFVLAVENAYQRPLVANKRCGLWYIPPEHLRETCYFKSTDGHNNQWNFSVKRLNLHLLSFIELHKGAIIVDSTRRGKSMPDAFSKTIPIWCAVLNRALFNSQEVFLPRNILSSSEFQQIIDRIDGWVDLLKRIVPDQNCYRVSKPLRPIWVTQSGMLPFETPTFEEFHPVILCTASEQVQDGQSQRTGYIYVQGAGDDHELWAGKLTPNLLWNNTELHGDLSAFDLISKIEAMSGEGEVIPDNQVKLTSYLSISSAPIGVNDLDLTSLPTKKKGIRELATKLASIDNEFANKGPSVNVVTTEPELGVAVCLMLNCLYFDDQGKPCSRNKKATSKEDVSRRLVPLAENGKALPSRALVNIVGSYLRT